jgi:hypothetical protein
MRVKILRAEVKKGVDAIDRGDAVDLDDNQLAEYLKGPAAWRRKHGR